MSQARGGAPRGVECGDVRLGKWRKWLGCFFISGPFDEVVDGFEVKKDDKLQQHAIFLHPQDVAG